jgi:hypothetical protein
MATVTDSSLLRDVPFPMQQCSVNTLVPNVAFNITLLGPSGLAPVEVSTVVTTEATTRDPVFVKHDPSLDSTANNTITLEPDTIPGGDITGAIIKVTITWNGVASGGIS